MERLNLLLEPGQAFGVALINRVWQKRAESLPKLNHRNVRHFVIVLLEAQSWNLAAVL